MKKILSIVDFYKPYWLEVAAGFFLFWFIIYPKPYKILLIVFLCMPIIGLFIHGLQNRPSVGTLVSVSPNKKNKYHLADFLLLPVLGLLSRFWLDYYLYPYHIFWNNFYNGIIPVLSVFSIMCIILFITHRSKIPKRRKKTKRWIYAILILNIFFYSYGTVYNINYIFDNSQPTLYAVQVIDKHKSDKHIYYKSRLTNSISYTVYSVKISSWKYNNGITFIRVPQKLYHSVSMGDTVYISVKEGFLNIPWYYIRF